MVEGNAAWLNQFNFGGYNYRTGAVLYEVAGSYNFHQSHFHGVTPFAILSVGGLTIKQRNGVNVNDRIAAVYVYPPAAPQPTADPIPNTLGTLDLTNNRSFFNFSYGGGVKRERLWGPIGARVDVRGGTIPNFLGAAQNSFEATGGVGQLGGALGSLFKFN